MHLPCFSGPMKTHLLDRHLIQTGEQMSCCSVICAFVLYSETQGTGHTHKHTQFKLKCIFLDMSLGELQELVMDREAGVL